MRFSERGHARIARHRWSAWTIRSLHTALHADQLTPDAADAVVRDLAQGTSTVTSDVVRTALISHTQTCDTADDPPPHDARDDDDQVPAPRSHAAAAAPLDTADERDDVSDAATADAMPAGSAIGTAPPASSRRDRAAAQAQAQAQVRVVRRVAGDLMRLGQQIATSDVAVADDLHAALDDVQTQLDVVRAALQGDPSAA